MRTSEEKKKISAGMKFAWSEGKFNGVRNGRTCPCIGQFNKNDECVAVYSSLKEVEKAGYHGSNVSACCHKRLPHYKKYYWEFITKANYEFFKEMLK